MAIIKDRFYWLLAALGLLAAWAVWRQMHWGPWAFSDSAAYIAAARNLAAGHGLSLLSPAGVYRPLTLHQPLYPWLLAGGLQAGLHPFTSTTLLNIASAFGCVFVLSAAVYARTGHKAAALALALAAASFPTLIDNLGGAMSEPLYLSLMLLGLASLLAYVAGGSRASLYISAACAALTMLARLVGAANVAAGALALLALAPGSRRARLNAALIFAVLGAVPALLWQLSLPALAGRSFSAPAELGVQSASFWSQLTSSLANSWVPQDSAWAGPVAALLGAGLLASLIAVAWQLWRGRTQTAWVHLGFVAGIHAVAYIMVCLAAFLFSNVQPDINPRTLLPLFPLLLWLGISGLLALSPRRPGTVNAALLGLAALAVLAWEPQTQRLVNERYAEGHGYTAVYYRDSELLRTARQLPQEAAWISNLPALFLLYLDKPTYDLAEIYPSVRATNNPALGEGDTALDPLMRNGGILLLYTPQLRTSLGADATTHIENLTRGLQRLYDGSEGQILIGQQ